MENQVSASSRLSSLLLICAIIGTVFLLSACVPMHNSGYGNDPYYDDPDDRYDYERERAQRERRKLERERERLEEEREQLERERENAERYRPPPPPPPAPERCPSGFEASERKCSKEERRNGCKDMRLPGGLGCVRR